MTPQDLLDDFRLALCFLTRLPVRLRGDPAEGALARASLMFPLAGVLVGLACAAIFAATMRFLPPGPCALLTVAAGILLTGGLHEDGLADCADGFGGGRDREAKLLIMKDSRIGAYGALALILSVLLRAAILAELAAPMRVAAALVAAHGLARAAVVPAMAALPPARPGGLAAGAGRVGLLQVSVAIMLAGWVAFLVLPLRPFIASLVAGALAFAVWRLLALRHIGGHTGDVLGATEQTAEIAVLLAILGTPP